MSERQYRRNVELRGSEVDVLRCKHDLLLVDMKRRKGDSRYHAPKSSVSWKIRGKRTVLPRVVSSNVHEDVNMKFREVVWSDGYIYEKI